MKIEIVTALKTQATKILEGIARGERAVLENRVLTHADAKQKMKKWLA